MCSQEKAAVLQPETPLSSILGSHNDLKAAVRVASFLARFSRPPTHRQGNSRSGGNDAERKESARAQESRQEGGGSDSGLEIAVGANNTPRQQQRREQQHHFFFLRAHAGCPPQNPARGPDGLFHELPCGRRILRHGDTDHPRSSGVMLPVIVAFSKSSGGGERAISGERFAAAIRSECFPP
ncbi:hypothetical protein THAOC_23041 [Thalassiosira oceanica]|uniref:Uncharacterized protein n=1 Tax=Thalassiosira oceanica TaxID=159749 RepID=K0RSZ5_THAOC|nr:hypothetical protein THAOC_23041 [Thalassiosira oceanica]|eukprot:EJK56968.1 hypothetical protein THAOC_23041 [Thalassiosira oceanica]